MDTSIARACSVDAINRSQSEGGPVQFARSCARVMGGIVRPVRDPYGKVGVSGGAVFAGAERILQAWRRVLALKKVSRLAPERREFGAEVLTIFVSRWC